ncbi:short-chain dehydrogenase [Microbacterium faecale]|uniref:Short-chain dehydrogenase n=1 Tax=Microbacterium faecale TaxID=1804630 RepID=A0A916Y205_9MICO|nr:SDR family NAD(P)-dependent oxidoreductase [Microbacterium faecale]GGD27295.1 short-chain dehydrogenase [Microbacterium faecale]
MTITLITGANKGIGYETAKRLVDAGHRVFLGARDVERGTAAAESIGARFVQLDVTDDASVAAAATVVAEAEGRLDLVIHNAGVLELELTGSAALRAFDTNAAGLVRVTEATLPLLRASADPAVVTISSSAGSFWAVTHPDRPEYALAAPLYSASKAAATMLTLQYAKAHPEIRFVAVEPGTTATDLTAGLGIGRPPAETANAITRIIDLGGAVRSGTLRDEFGPIAW